MRKSAVAQVVGLFRQIQPRPPVWNLETTILGMVGVGMVGTSATMRKLIFSAEPLFNFNVVVETIILVIFLGGLMGITRIPFPRNVFGRPIPVWGYPIISGLISGFMDSFLVLILVGSTVLEGPDKDRFRFRAINMIAALIGGLTLYFGEVYMLPLALKYGMHSWHSMLPIVPPVLLFLAALGFVSRNLNIRVVGMMAPSHSGSAGHNKKSSVDQWDYAEFIVAIGLLLATHDALLCLGTLFVYSYTTGQGEDMIDVMKTETEVSVVLLLVLAAFLFEPAKPFMAHFQGWWAFVPSIVNGVFTGALFPATGNIWRETLILSTSVLVTPISSLVGVMLFKRIGEWKDYVKLALPFALLWFSLCAGWFFGPWRLIEQWFYRVFPAPSLV